MISNDRLVRTSDIGNTDAIHLQMVV